MITKIKDFLLTLLKMSIAGIVCYVVYIGPGALFRAAANDLSEKMTIGRSLWYLLAMLALQLLYCCILANLRYNSWGEGIRRLTEDCKTEPYRGLWKDMKKLISKEQTILIVGLVLITLTTMQFFVPAGMSLTSFFIGITGVTIVIPDVLMFLLVSDPTLPNIGAIMFSCIIGMFGSLLSFSGMYLCLVSLKRKKWYKEWKV